MNSLHELQSGFQRAVLAGELRPGLFEDERADTSGGLRLYLAAYRARLAAALRDNFAVLHRALGDDAFADLARAYIDACPSRFPSIRWFGDGLADFLDATPERLPHPALADVARMNWAVRGAFDAENALPMTLHDLAALPSSAWAQHRFVLLPSLRVVDLNWSIEPIWRALNDDAEAQIEAPESLSHALLVWRPELDCLWRSLDSVEATALRALARTANFADCCVAIAETGIPDPATMAASLLQRWVVDGLLVKN